MTVNINILRLFLCLKIVAKKLLIFKKIPTFASEMQQCTLKVQQHKA